MVITNVDAKSPIQGKFSEKHMERLFRFRVCTSPFPFGIFQQAYECIEFCESLPTGLIGF